MIRKIKYLSDGYWQVHLRLSFGAEIWLHLHLQLWRLRQVQLHRSCHWKCTKEVNNPISLHFLLILIESKRQVIFTTFQANHASLIENNKIDQNFQIAFIFDRAKWISKLIKDGFTFHFLCVFDKEHSSRRYCIGKLGCFSLQSTTMSYSLNSLAFRSIASRYMAKALQRWNLIMCIKWRLKFTFTEVLTPTKGTL